MNTSNYMIIKEIPKNDQNLLSASVYINSFTRAIEELVYNSLDAESNSIAIRINIRENFIQVLDNGCGIEKHNFKLLGNKYASSKYIDITTLKSAPNKYGFRGLSLASIIEISRIVKISSKFHTSNKTWIKTFANGKVSEFASYVARPSKGTTVEIIGFLYNLTIQNKCIDPVKELQYIKLGLEQLSLVHCNVSISLRDDSKNDIIFKVNKNRDIYQTLQHLFEIQQHDVNDLQVEKKNYKVRAFIGTLKDDTKKYNWIYLNGRIVFKTNLHKKINNAFSNYSKSDSKNIKYKNLFTDENHVFKKNIPFYFIFISCPNYDYDIIYENKKTLVEFKDWQEIDKLIEKLIKFYLGDVVLKPLNMHKSDDKKENPKDSSTRKKVRKIIERILRNNSVKPKISQLKKGIKGKNIKRKKIDVSLKNITNKNLLNDAVDLSKIIDLKVKAADKNEYNEINKFNTPKTVQINEKQKSKRSTKKNNPELIKQKIFPELLNNPNYMVKNAALQKPKRSEHNKSKYKNYVQKKFNKRKENKFIERGLPHQIINKDVVKYEMPFKTSYDLIKPVIDIFSLTPANQYFSIQNFQSYSATCETFKTKSTYNSHYNNVELKKNVTRHFISTNSRENFLVNEQKIRNYKKMSKNTLKILNETVFKQHSLKNEIEENSNEIYISQFNINNSTINYDKGGNSKGVLKDKFTYSIDINHANTYTIDVFSSSLFTHNTHQTEQKINCTHKSQYKEPPTSLFNNEDLLENAKNIVISDSQSLEPLNFCEAVFKNSYFDDMEKEFNISFANKSAEGDNNSEYYGNDVKNAPLMKNDIETDVKDNLDGQSKMDSMINKQNDIIAIRTIAGDKVENALDSESENKYDFKLKGRHTFVPKGMSQIFINSNTKNTTAYDLQQEYYEDDIYKNFAKEVLDNIKIFEPNVENVKDVNKLINKVSDKFNKDNNDLIFTPNSLKYSKVFGQIDRKFIVAVVQGRNLQNGKCSDFLVLFDQHAVDERIRLESNLKEYYDGNEWKSVEIDSVIKLKLSKEDYHYLYNHKEKFYQFGLQWLLTNNEILIHAIPLAILGKNIRDVDTVFKAVKSLISEQIDVIKLLKGNVSSYPKSIMDLVFSEACRYAIKFGDKLSKNDCVSMIKALSECKTPFQCAHGRPVMAVLIELTDNKTKYMINFDAIQKFKSFFK